MKIGITGDTHGRIESVRSLLKVIQPVDYWFHTGDYSQDARFLQLRTNLPLAVVSGNTDKPEGRANIDEFPVLEGYKIWLTHGHKYLKGQGIEELVWWARILEVNIVVFGHIHRPIVEWFGDILVINPGSLALPRSEDGATYAVLTLNKGAKPSVNIYSLLKNELLYSEK